MITEFSSSLTEIDILARLWCAGFLALLIWLERELWNQPAGIRTHILIAIWSALFMIISIILPEMYHSSVSDPGRIAAQVVSWVGFLWAWAIMKIGLNTKWLTTAANIWATAAIWLAAWAGLYTIALIAAILMLVNLIFIEKLKSVHIKKKRFCSIQLEFDKMKLSNKKFEEKIVTIPMDIVTKNIKEDTKKTDIRIIAKIDNNYDISEIHQTIRELEWLSKISIWEYVK